MLYKCSITNGSLFTEQIFSLLCVLIQPKSRQCRTESRDTAPGSEMFIVFYYILITSEWSSGGLTGLGEPAALGVYRVSSLLTFLLRYSRTTAAATSSTSLPMTTTMMMLNTDTQELAQLANLANLLANRLTRKQVNTHTYTLPRKQ